MNVYSDLCPISENGSLTILKQLEDYLLNVNNPGDIDTKDQTEWSELAANFELLMFFKM